MAKQPKSPERKRANAAATEPTEPQAESVETLEERDAGIEDLPEAATTPALANPGSASGGAPDEPTARVYRGKQEVDHDLYKLNVATMRKNVSFTDVPEWHQFAHEHIFHTIDSNGEPQKASQSVGGHHHDVTIVHVEGGAPKLKISGPRKYVQKKGKGIISVPVSTLEKDGEEGDYHTHSTTYLGSERIKLRETNLEYVKALGKMQAAAAPVPGVVG